MREIQIRTIEEYPELSILFTNERYDEEESEIGEENGPNNELEEDPSVLYIDTEMRENFGRDRNFTRGSSQSKGDYLEYRGEREIGTKEFEGEFGSFGQDQEVGDFLKYKERYN